MNVRGRVYALYVFEAGERIALQTAAGRLDGAHVERAVRHVPQGFAGSGEVPSVVTWTEGHPPTVAGQRPEPEVELRGYAFGTVVVTYAVVVDGPARTLADLGRALHAQSVLREDARDRVERAVRSLGEAVSRAHVSEQGESYLVFRVQPEGSRRDFWAQEGAAVTQALHVEEQVPASELVGSPGDGADGSRTLVIDWFAALLLGEEKEDERRALELALAELLKLRVLDARLDGLLEDAHAALGRPRRLGRGGFGRGDIDRIARMQADAAMHFEGVENAVRFLGNRYLARVYRIAGDRLQLDRWAASVQRKVDTLESIYGKLSDRMSHLPTEALQWVTIALIAISLAVSLWKLG